MAIRKMYDWSPELKAALVADDDFNDIEYVALEGAPQAAPEGSTGYSLLVILHSLAYARLLGGFLPKGEYVKANQWTRYSQLRKNPKLPAPDRQHV